MRMAASGAALLGILTLIGCGSKTEPERTAAGGSGVPGAAPTPAGASAPASGIQGSATAYDPKADPLVNPASLFEPAPADTKLIAEDETLVRHLEGNPANLNPIFISATVEFFFSALLFDGLFTFDNKLQWKVNSAVVEKFEESPDHLAYTVTMKPGLKWQDGHPYGAEDVCYSWREIRDDRVPCPSVKQGMEELPKCEVLDARTVRLHHRESLPTSKWNVGFPIIPKHLYEKDKEKNPDLKSGEYYNNLNRAPVGSGPYKFVKWVENDKIELERWDDYHGPKPHFKRIVFRIVPEQNVALLTFNKGDLDEFRLTAKQFATQTGSDSEFARQGYKVLDPDWSISYIGWNQDGSNPFFSDVRVRRAMTHACDIERMIRDLAFNLFTPARGIFAPGHPSFPADIERLRFDLDEAARLLDEAGWKADDAREGWRHKTIDGKPVKFEFTMLLPQGAQISIDLAAIYQQDLKSIGIDMKQQVLEWATFQERTRKHEFHASIAVWGTGVDPDTLWGIWRSDEYRKGGESGRNYGGYSNKRVDELFELGRKEFDPAKRADHYREISRLIYQDQPYTFLWNRGTTWAVAKRLRGLQTSPRGIFLFDPAEFGWWVRPEEARYPLAQKL